MCFEDQRSLREEHAELAPHYPRISPPRNRDRNSPQIRKKKRLDWVELKYCTPVEAALCRVLCPNSALINHLQQCRVTAIPWKPSSIIDQNFSTDVTDGGILAIDHGSGYPVFSAERFQSVA